MAIRHYANHADAALVLSSAEVDELRVDSTLATYAAENSIKGAREFMELLVQERLEFRKKAVAIRVARQEAELAKQNRAAAFGIVEKEDG